MDLADDGLRDRARQAGIAPDWTDVTGQTRSVAPETLRRLLERIGEADAAAAAVPPLVTGLTGQAIPLPPAAGDGAALLVLESGVRIDIAVHRGDDGRGWVPPILEPGYHHLRLRDHEITLAVAPPRCFNLDDIARGGRLWGLAAQIYGLRRPHHGGVGDGGIGDSGGVAELARAAGRRGADALALSPTHALFTAEPQRFGPYSPSSRLFLNPLLADPAALFGAGRVAAAIRTAGLDENRRRCEGAELIDWPAAAQAKLALLRALYDGFDIEAGPLAADFAGLVHAGGALLEDHARFEALQAARLAADPADRDWRRWPAALRDPASAAVAEFAAAHPSAVRFHAFLQWVADRALADAQSQARSAGMRIGLVADLAVGMDATGSHAWSRPADVLGGASIGSPPDAFNAAGQNWTLAAISPRAMRETGFAPFLATLRAALRHAGGVRIDHVMGLARLWLVPDGLAPTEGAYLSYPVEDLLRLVALESHRHRAVVIGEDLGTLPWGFADQLADRAVAGMRVLWFEREGDGFKPAERWSPTAVAMSSTHDLPPVAGWWRGTDIAARAAMDQYPDGGASEQAQRTADRATLWQAIGDSAPPPESPAPVVDAALRFVARSPGRLALLPLEDVLGLEEQPNLPGTIDEHPNWRRRLTRPADEALAEPDVAARLAAIRRERQR